jgi:HEAT repeat protein
LGARKAALDALGYFEQKRAAAYLMSVLENDNEEEAVRQAVRNDAADALAHMTGRPFGHDLSKWSEWWATNQPITDEQWRQQLLQVKAANDATTQRQLLRLQQQVHDVLNKVYQGAANAQQLQLLLDWLRSEDPTIRFRGADLVYERHQGAQRIDDPIIAQLLLMVGDSSVEVRTQVIVDLKVINDPAAVEPLLAQLAVEIDPNVKVNIAVTLGELRQLSAVAPLLRLLDDPNVRVAESAAEALATLGPQIHDNAGLRAAVGDKLAAKLQEINQQPGAENLRAAILDAEGPLQNVDMYDTFAKSLDSQNQNNTLRVRTAAVRGLAKLGDSSKRESAAADLTSTMHQDPDAAVRLEAVKAVGDVGTLVSEGGALYERMSQKEQDASVSSAAWKVLLSLCSRPDVTADTLQRSWVTQQLIEADPQKLLDLDQVLRDKLIAIAPSDPKAQSFLADVRQNIGNLCMRLHQWDEAISNYRPALDYWLSHPAPEATKAELSKQLMIALLKSGDYARAVQFAGERIKADDQQQQNMGECIRNEVIDLHKAHDLKNAVELADLALKMQPPLVKDYADQIRQERDQMGQELAKPSTNSTDRSGSNGSGQ